MRRVITPLIPMNIKALCLAALTCLFAAVAHAFPIAAPGTEGFKVFVVGTDPIIATYEGNSAAYSNDLYLTGFGFIFNNHTSAVGSTVDLGSYAIGTELEFYLFVNNTGYTYYTGPASRNADNHEHARVESNWGSSGTTLVSFEDLFNGPFDYNDLSFSFTNTGGGTTPPTNEVPDTGASLIGVLLGLISLVPFARGRRS